MYWWFPYWKQRGSSPYLHLRASSEGVERMSNERTVKIQSGPSKFDLQKSLFDRTGNGGKPHQVTFRTVSGAIFTVIIFSVSVQEEGSEESWQFKGRTTSLKMKGRKIKLRADFTGWYSTDDRGGRLDFSTFFTIPITQVRVGDTCWVGCPIVTSPVLDHPPTRRWCYQVRDPMGCVVNQFSNGEMLAVKWFTGL